MPNKTAIPGLGWTINAVDGGAAIIDITLNPRGHIVKQKGPQKMNCAQLQKVV